MTDKDILLIDQANKLHFDDWDICSNLEDQAETLEAKEIISDIRKSLYHKSEGSDI